MFKGLVSLFQKSGSSDKVAKNRLQMVLVQDRTGLNQSEMDNFRKDILDVIEKYFSLERKTVEIDWQRNDGLTALVINTPVAGRIKEQKKAVNG